MFRVSCSLGVVGAARRRAVLGTLAATSLLAVAPAVSNAAVIVGTPGPDRLVGTNPGGDLLFGGGGADTVIGGDGNDTIYGVRSGNTLSGGEGSNYIEGGAGDDVITAGNGTNTVYGGSGHDTITLGDGNNYVDPGGAPDVVKLGNGNNVVNGGSGGLDLTAGNGNNLVYASGLDTVALGSGVNTVYVANTWNIGSVDCGGNPGSTLYVATNNDPKLNHARALVASGKFAGCPNMVPYTAIPVPKAKMAGEWEHFNITGTDGNDKIFGGHGGGWIDGKGGNNILWADYLHDTGGAQAQSKTTTIKADDGDNTVYGGRGTNYITLGNGDNFIRGGAWNNTITVGSGHNNVRLQGKGRNTVTINGGTGYVEAFANSYKPKVTCKNGAQVTVVYGNTRPKTNCPVVASARSAQGKVLQVQGVEHLADSDAPVSPAPRAGELAGIPRPF